MKKALLIFLFSCLFLFSASFASAQSTYVLPYPSVMPGGISYKIHLAWEKFLQYWYFGNLGQYTYNLKESDKYLVEAKTLFEYQQYLLGYNALIKSDKYFENILPFLTKAKNEGKDVSQYRLQLYEASLKHIEVLQTLESQVPSIVDWQPEKSTASVLNLKNALDSAIDVRKKDL